MNVSAKLRGTGVALVTPFSSNGSVDFGGLEKLIEHVISNGVDYLVTLGTTGEAPVLSWEEKMEIVSKTIDICHGRIPVVLGLGTNNTQELLEKLEKLPELNLAAILSVSPYYNKPSQEGIYGHYMQVADNTPYPIILYNVPGRTGSNIDATTTLKLASHDNIIGIKDATPDLTQLANLAALKPSEFLLISGEDSLAFHTMCLGGDGLISVLANYLPEDVSSMIRFGLEGKYKQALDLHLKLLEGYRLSTLEGNPTSIKAALESFGITARKVRLPLAEASSELVAKFENWYQDKKRKGY